MCVHFASYKVTVYDDFSNVLNYKGAPDKRTLKRQLITERCELSVKQLERCTRIRITFLNLKTSEIETTLGVVDLTGECGYAWA